MNGKERILTALRRGVPDRVPLFEWFIDARVGEAMTNSDNPLDIVERLDLDGVNLRANYEKQFLDDTIWLDEWGMKRQLTGDVLPAVLESPIQDITQHKAYTFPDPDTDSRFVTVEQALRRFGDTRAIILNLRDGFSEMRDLLGYENALMAMLLEPVAFSELLARAIDYNLELAKVARRRYGIEMIATTDDVANASGMIMRPETYFELLAPGFRRVIEGYKDLGCLCIKHCDGNVDAVLDFWIDSGIDCLDPIDPCGGYTMKDMRARLGNRVCLKGNIDCTGALCDGTPEEVRQEVRECMWEGGREGAFILSSSNTIHRGVSPENFRAMLDTWQQEGQYPLRG
jgi:uroporphyrinogen decarboxylase